MAIVSLVFKEMPGKKNRRQSYKQILALKKFSQSSSFVQSKKALNFELLFIVYCTVNETVNNKTKTQGN